MERMGLTASTPAETTPMETTTPVEEARMKDGCVVTTAVTDATSTPVAATEPAPMKEESAPTTTATDATSAPQSAPMPPTRREAEAPIKKEFLKPFEETPRGMLAPEERDDRDRRQRGTFKKRPVDAMSNAADSLCRLVASGGTCAFGDSCKFSHDVDDYMKRKPKDLADTCPVFAAFGYCRYGVACRFARAHTFKDSATGVWCNQDDRAEDAREKDPEMNHESNALTDEVRTMLRKNQYPFRSTVQGGKKRKGRGGGGGNGNGNGGAPRDESKKAEEQATPQDARATTSDASAAATTATPVTNELTTTANSEVPVANGAEATTMLATAAKEKAEPVETSGGALLRERKPVDFKRKIYVAPLTTVGNLPFRRLLKQTGADITCGEMAMALNLLKTQQSEWALLRRHESEDVFGVQLAGSHGDQMARVCELLTRETDVDFIDLNMGCPIDVVCRTGAGSALMTRPPRMMDVISGALTGIELGMSVGRRHGHRALPVVTPYAPLTAPGLTVKLRTGWSDKSPVAHKLVAKIQRTRASSVYMNASVVQGDAPYTLQAVQGVDAITIHGRSRLQRYTKTADWDYVFQCRDAARTDAATDAGSEAMAVHSDDGVPFIGGGDVLSFSEFDDHLKNGKLETCMIARGALIKPWLPTEIKERRHYDISSSERLDLLRDFVRFGLEHWGSDQKGINRTRRYLLEWQSFLCRYIPVGVLETLPQHINHRPSPYYGRDDLETLMASDQAVDWIKISEMLLGPVPNDFQFQPKHKANAYSTS